MTTTYAWGATGMRQIDDPEKVNVAFVQHEDFARAEAEVARLKDSLRQANVLRDTLIRLSKWDHLNSAADGPFWAREIANAIEATKEKP